MSRYNVLVARLQRDLSKVQMAVRAATSQAKKAEQTGDLDYLQAAALSLQNFYTGVERIFEEIAKQVDELIPVGGSSHQELLEQMALEIAEIRPPVIQPDTLEALNEYRGFRHVVVHLYGFELYPDRIRQLIRGLPTCCNALIRDVNAFCEFLSRLGQSLQG